MLRLLADFVDHPLTRVAASLIGLATALPIEAIARMTAKVACFMKFSLVGSVGRKKPVLSR